MREYKRVCRSEYNVMREGGNTGGRARGSRGRMEVSTTRGEGVHEGVQDGGREYSK